MIDSTILLAEGGLFDLNATLPLMMIQLLVLAVVLNALFFKPLGKVLDDRSDYVSSNRLGAQEKLDKSKALVQQFETELSDTRRQAQALIAEAQADAQKLAAEELAVAQGEAQVQREQVQTEINAQRSVAMATLDQQIDALSNQILDKLLAAAK
jgi:F-type H+-transporting ATPase subunit b